MDIHLVSTARSGSVKSKTTDDTLMLPISCYLIITIRYPIKLLQVDDNRIEVKLLDRMVDLRNPP